MENTNPDVVLQEAMNSLMSMPADPSTFDATVSVTPVTSEATPVVAKPVKKQQTPDVRMFTGYIACDGTPHKSAKEAIAHSESIKVKDALNNIAEAVANAGTADDFVSDEGSGPFIAVENLPDFLLAYRTEITAAFAQVVKMRAPRGSKKVAAPVVTPTA